MKIIELRAQNIKRLTAVAIRPDGEIVEIAGDNGAGKTSVLDSIWWGLAGQEAVQNDPIRHGQKEASVFLDLGELRVHRLWKETHNGLRMSLKVESTSGEQKSPQAILDRLVGSLTFDPLDFSRMKPRDQRDLLMDLVGVSDDLARLDRDRKEVYDERTQVNREVDRLKAQVGTAPTGATNADIDALGEIPTEMLVKELKLAQEVKQRNAELRMRYEGKKSEFGVAQRAVARLEKELQAAEEHLAQTLSEMNALECEVRELVDPDLNEIHDCIADNDRHNALVRDMKAYRARSSELKAAEERSDQLTKAIGAIDAEKARILAERQFPIDGLSFSEGGVCYGEVPFAQCSAAEQLRVSVAIGMALNPKLRVLRITDGSLLDRNNLALLQKMAAERDFQIWIERVEPGTKSAVMIEDGHICGGSEK